MQNTTKLRKKRSDRNHLVYQITCIANQQQYIGVTVAKGAAIQKTLKTRWKAHLYKALVLQQNWQLCAAIRDHGPDQFVIQLVCKIRGKAAAFAVEASLINHLRPTLNTRKKVTC